MHLFAETEWRKKPTHQGGYLLDGGVHYMAGLRQLLESQSGNHIVRLSAFTNQLRDYLPPADTINAVLKTKSGITGTFQLSVGTSLREDSWTVSCESGWITVEDSKVIICRDGQVTKKTVPNERTGVPPEVRAWGEALATGKIRKEQEPEAALADLELVSFATSNDLECCEITDILSRLSLCLEVARKTELRWIAFTGKLSRP